MLFNLIHRIADNPCYVLQQQLAHGLGLKVTIFFPSEALQNDKLVQSAIADREMFHDEIALWLNSPNGVQPHFPWLISEESKQAAVRDSVALFAEKFGDNPRSVGNYVLDSSLIRLIHQYCPEATTVVAGCFEEGTRVYHGCNNSWYLFSEGMPWGPWYPAREHSFRPAKNEDDWSGLVAVPHLSRDLVLAYEGRNDFFASHPGNVQRGLANDGLSHNYDYNLCDQYRLQEDYNDGFSYFQYHVSSPWLSGSININDPDEVTQQIYQEALEYLAQLKQNGAVEDLTLCEFGARFRQEVPIGKPAVALGKEILYGSGKQYFWISSPDYRVLLDLFQGGSIGDLRPYAARFAAFTGPDSPQKEINSYPYLIQSQLRTGIKTHSSDGSRTTLKLLHNGEEKDLCFFPTRVEEIRRKQNRVTAVLKPVTIRFSDSFSVVLQTIYFFTEDGSIQLRRKVQCKEEGDLLLQEYLKGSYGFTEYPEEMGGITLSTGTDTLQYAYRGRTLTAPRGQSVSCAIPAIHAQITLAAESAALSAEITEGHLFSPFYTMKLNYQIDTEEKEIATWIRISTVQ